MEDCRKMSEYEEVSDDSADKERVAARMLDNISDELPDLRLALTEELQMEANISTQIIHVGYNADLELFEFVGVFTKRGRVFVVLGAERDFRTFFGCGYFRNQIYRSSDDILNQLRNPYSARPVGSVFVVNTSINHPANNNDVPMPPPDEAPRPVPPAADPYFHIRDGGGEIGRGGCAAPAPRRAPRPVGTITRAVRAANDNLTRAIRPIFGNAEAQEAADLPEERGVQEPNQDLQPAQPATVFRGLYLNTGFDANAQAATLNPNINPWRTWDMVATQATATTDQRAERNREMMEAARALVERDQNVAEGRDITMAGRLDPVRF